MNTQINLAKSPVSAPVASPNAGQVATIDFANDGGKYTAAHRKENAGLYKAYAAVVPSSYKKGAARKVVDLRIYFPRETAYACIWIGNDTFHASGSGKAGGYGYCKESTAAGQAMTAAGVKLSKYIQGVGTQAVEDAVLAIATALGYPDAMLVVSHP